MMFIALMAAALTATPPEIRTWEFAAAPGEAVALDLVRADVAIEAARDGKTTIAVRAAGSAHDLAGFGMRFERADGVLRLRDAFPRRSRLQPMRECLPPPGARGDFAGSSVRLDVTVRAPLGQAIPVSVLDGRVVDRR
jgi:hypothetical protein